MGSTQTDKHDDVIYRYLDPDDPDQAPAEIESMCPQCELNGTTKLLLTRIPFYKKVILMSFSCDECGYRNNELQSGEAAMEKGVKLVLKVNDMEDLNRQVIKSEYASLVIPEVELEIPAKSQPGEITTVEGIIRRCMEALSASQYQRETSTQTAVSAYLPRLSSLLTLANGPFTLILQDASGNSFIENPNPQTLDKQLTTIRYDRTLDDNKLLALVDDDAVETADPVDEGDQTAILKNEVMHFDVQCPNCTVPIQSNMKIVDIPHFKEVVLMSTNCESCGYKNTEIQASKGISEQAVRYTLHLSGPEDLNRDVIKSDTCTIRVPELDLECGMAALSGRFTTVEGILNAMKNQLSGDDCMMLGDSAVPEKRTKMTSFLEKLDDVTSLKKLGTIVFDDPAGNSYIQLLGDTNDCDQNLTVEWYDRTFEQNESLGLNDMKTEGYENDAHQTSDNASAETMAS